jgi:hypothetical protein
MQGRGNMNSAKIDIHTKVDAQTDKQNFADTLKDWLNKDETFYFTIEGGNQSGVNIPIEQAEMLIGWDSTKERICYQPGQLSIVCAMVRKDWSGVILQPFGQAIVLVNNETITGPYRLTTGDILIMPKQENDQTNVKLIFHEPESLVMLETLLPQGLPQPVLNKHENSTNASLNDSLTNNQSDQGSKSSGSYELLDSTDLILLVCGTLLAAIVVFLILHFSM